MSHPREIARKLKEADAELSDYVNALAKENRKLQKTVAMWQARCASKDNEIEAIKQAQPKMNIVVFGSPEKGKV
jgi:hypothetical protein